MKLPDTEYDLGDYKCKVEPFKGLKLKDIQTPELKCMVIQTNLSNKDFLSKDLIDFVTIAEKYLSQQKPLQKDVPEDIDF